MSVRRSNRIGLPAREGNDRPVFCWVGAQFAPKRLTPCCNYLSGVIEEWWSKDRQPIKKECLKIPKGANFCKESFGINDLPEFSHSTTWTRPKLEHPPPFSEFRKYIWIHVKLVTADNLNSFSCKKSILLISVPLLSAGMDSPGLRLLALMLRRKKSFRIIFLAI